MFGGQSERKKIMFKTLGKLKLGTQRMTQISF